MQKGKVDLQLLILLKLLKDGSLYFLNVSISAYL